MKMGLFKVWYPIVLPWKDGHFNAWNPYVLLQKGQNVNKSPKKG